MKIRFLSKLIIIVFISSFAYSKNIYSSQQLLYENDKVLESIKELGFMTKTNLMIDSTPISIAELKLQLKKINYESLSEKEKSLYNEIFDYFDNEQWNLESGGFKFSINLNLTPQFLYKSNSDIDWTFATDYTNTENYGAASNYEGNRDVKKLISVPFYFGWGDLFFIETEPSFSKSFWGFSKDSNLSNIVFVPADMEFLFPSNAYFSTGKAFDNWGFNFFIAKEGLSIGRSQTGNVIYNSTFVTDCVVQFDLYSEKFKYTLNVAEVDNSKFLYLHYIDFAPLNLFRIGIIEGTLIENSFELRYLNPLMITHSFGSWNEYASKKEQLMYGEAHVCAYFGFNFDIYPCKNLRIYGAYAQNELQSFLELGNPLGDSIPDSYSFQVGSEYNFYGAGGKWSASLEGIYSTPYSYVKQGAEWSLYRARKDMNSGIDKPICSWIGTPFGPDSIAAQAKIQYTKNQKWNAGLEYLFVAHGENSFGMFNEKWKDSEGNEWYNYYPSASFLQNKDSVENATIKARNLLPSGTVSYTNRISARGAYKLNRHVSFEGVFNYSFIFNNKNISEAFSHGVEIELSASWTMI